MSTGVPVAGDPAHVDPSTNPPPDAEAAVVLEDPAVVLEDPAVVLEDPALDVVGAAALVDDEDFEELPQAVMQAPATITDTTAGHFLGLVNLVSASLR